MPKGITLTAEEHRERCLGIAGYALGLFEEKGFQKTSMREIADGMGMGKSSLYDFFKSKDEIVVFAYEETMNEAIARAKAVAAAESSPELCLRRIMDNNLAYTREHKHLIVFLNAESRYLEEADQKRLHQVRHAYQDIVQSVVETGIAKGLFRPVNPALATRLLINSMLSVAYTSRPSGTLEDMLEEAVDVFLFGIRSQADISR